MSKPAWRLVGVFVMWLGDVMQGRGKKGSLTG